MKHLNFAMKNFCSATLVWFILVGLDLVIADDIYRGILTLDDFTFDKIVSKFRYSLLKFDNPYPYGKEHENFVRLGRELSSFSQIVVANLEVKDFGEKDSFEIAKRYGITREQFPALVMVINKELKTDYSESMMKIKKDQATFIKYPEQRNKTTDKIVLNPNEMRLFVWKYTDGEIRATLPNCTKQLDRLAEKFVKLLETNGEEQEFQDIFAKVSKISQTNKQPEAENYRRLMEKGKERGTLFYESERERVDSLLDSNSITIAKRNELNAYRNVLHSFLPVSAVLVEDDKLQKKKKKKKKNNKNNNKVEL